MSVAVGSVWLGWNHGSRWMVFAGDEPGLFDLWCMDPMAAPSLRFGQIIAGRDGEWIRGWLDPEEDLVVPGR